MTTNNSILVANVPSNKSNNMVWAVYAQGNEQATAIARVRTRLCAWLSF